MDTIKIDKNNVKLIAHRGVSGIERENTAAAFVAAGNRSYYGIETDVHVTKDGKFVIIHDDDTQRVYGEAFSVEGSDFSLLRSLRLTDKNGEKREDLCLPEPGEYLRICKTYNKTAVLELKNQMPEKQIREIYEVIKKEYHLEKMIFISFCYENLAVLRFDGFCRSHTAFNKRRGIEKTDRSAEKIQSRAGYLLRTPYGGKRKGAETKRHCRKLLDGGR